jgi:transposase
MVSMLVEAAWVAVKTPGPLRAFFERVRARRGMQIAVVATARKLACLCWTMLARGEDYAFARPSLTAQKLRRLELRDRRTKARGVSSLRRPRRDSSTPRRLG